MTRGSHSSFTGFGPAGAALSALLLMITGCGSPTYVRSGLENDGAPGIDVESMELAGSGGAPLGSGGVFGSGGFDGSGGVGTGGASETGGTTGTGGDATGGSQGTGGTTGSGGTATGGAGTGGTGTGGAATGGAATGGARTGGAGVGGAATGGGGTGGVATGGAGTGGAGTGGAVTDNARFNFEAATSAQPWAAAANTPGFASITRSTALHYAGQASLAASIASGGANLYQVTAVPSPAIPAGAMVTFHVFVPTGSTIDWVQPYVQDSAFAWTGAYALVTDLTVGAWNTFTLKVPTPSAAIAWIGTQVHVTGVWTGTVYLDAVNW